LGALGKKLRAADEAARLSLPEAKGLPEFHFGTLTKLYKKSCNAFAPSGASFLAGCGY